MSDLIVRMWSALIFAIRAVAHSWEHREYARLAVAMGDYIEAIEARGSGSHFEIHARTEGVALMLYQGDSGRRARSTIERLRDNPEVLSWVAYRDGQRWDWGPRE